MSPRINQLGMRGSTEIGQEARSRTEVPVTIEIGVVYPDRGEIQGKDDLLHHKIDPMTIEDPEKGGIQVKAVAEADNTEKPTIASQDRPLI